MRNRRILNAVLAVALLGSAILLLKFGSTSELDPEKENSRAQTTTQTGSQGHSDKATSSGSKSENRISGATIAVLQGLGFEISGDRIGRNSAEGSVEIRTPDGTTIMGDELKVSPSGDSFFVRGGVGMQKDSNSIESVDENAYVKISTKDGSFSASRASWNIKASAPNKKTKKPMPGDAP